MRMRAAVGRKAAALVAGVFLTALAAVSIVIGGVSWAGPAGDAKAQIKTAITHAGFAGGGTTLSYVQQHLGHALNCLEGTKGKNFNQSWGHVCQGQGNGVLEDLKTTPGGGDFMLVAQQADALAVAGVGSKNLNEARNAARGVAALLTIIQDNLK